MNNYYKLLSISVIILIVSLFSACQFNKEINTFKDVTYIKDVYKLIEEEEFFVGKIESNTIVLKDREFNIIKSIKITSSAKMINIKSILKENQQIYFIIDGSVDDSRGIMVCKSKNINMDGLYKIIRIDGNVYYYQTYVD